MTGSLRSLGCARYAFPPYDEDYGYVTLEAFLGKVSPRPMPVTRVRRALTDSGRARAASHRGRDRAPRRSPHGGRPRRRRPRARARHYVDRRRGAPDGVTRRPMTTSTSVVIPAFNEAAAIGPVVAGLRGAATWHEILVIDDGSNDGTADRAAAAGARVIRHPYNKGNGAAVKTGIRQSTGRYILIMDGDGQHQPRTRRDWSRARGVRSVIGALGSVARQPVPRRQPGAQRRRGLPRRTLHCRSDLRFRAAARDGLLEFLHLLPTVSPRPRRRPWRSSRPATACDSNRSRRQAARPIEDQAGADGVRFLLILLKVVTIFSRSGFFFPSAARVPAGRLRRMRLDAVARHQFVRPADLDERSSCSSASCRNRFRPALRGRRP